jgi:predicted amidohydrolase YtcJ
MNCGKKAFVFITLLFLFISSTCLFAQRKEIADLILFNGKIATMDEANPSAEAVAVKGDKILAVGKNADIKLLAAKETKLIDLKGKFLMPGFNESHAHFWGLGKFKQNIDLMQTKNWNEIVALVKKAVAKAKPGEWILGRGWHQEKWNKTPMPNIAGFPYHNELSKISPNNPVILKHASGHAIFVNAKSMEIAGITKDTRNPEGGIIMRDSNGDAIGVFHENAADLINKQYDLFLSKRSPAQVKADWMKTLNSAVKECVEKGITTFNDAGSTFEDIDYAKEAADSGALAIRLNAMLGESNAALKDRIKNYKIIGYANNHLSVREIKRYIDGALGSRSAWFLDEYADMPGQSGLNVEPLEDLAATAEIAMQNGFQLCIHAIGDRGNREVLNIYENIFKKNPGQKDLRWRIEHAQHLSLQDIPRFAKLGVIAAMQTCHCTSDAGFVPKRIGDKRAAEGAYVWQKLMKSGAVVCNGTDAPVESVDPIKNFYSSVTRLYDGGKEFYADQKMSRLEGLKAYTVNSAYASFEDKIKGKIVPGMLADFTVLTNNLLTCSESEILKTKVASTIIGGKIVYSQK